MPNWVINVIYAQLSNVKNTDWRLLDLTETISIKTLLFENWSVDVHADTGILNAINEYILITKRFEEPLSHS